MAPDLLVNVANIPPQHQGIILRIVAKVSSQYIVIAEYF